MSEGRLRRPGNRRYEWIQKERKHPRVGTEPKRKQKRRREKRDISLIAGGLRGVLLGRENAPLRAGNRVRTRAKNPGKMEQGARKLSVAGSRQNLNRRKKEEHDGGQTWKRRQAHDPRNPSSSSRGRSRDRSETENDNDIGLRPTKEGAGSNPTGRGWSCDPEREGRGKEHGEGRSTLGRTG